MYNNLLSGLDYVNFAVAKKPNKLASRQYLVQSDHYEFIDQLATL